MKYCKRCLYPENHPYGLLLDAQGVCMGCRVHEEKDVLDWDARFAKLRTIIDANTRNARATGFDCIVPVTGGGDSYFIVHTVKNVLGMNPLLVHYNSHYNTRVGIRNLANLQTVFDCEMLESTMSPSLVKRITRHTLREHGSIYWQVLAGFLTFPVQVAVKFRIPLIIWGVHPWSEQTGMFSHLDEVEMTERARKEHGLMGISAEALAGKGDLSRADVQGYVYPYDNELEAVGVRGIYLSNYLRWDAKAQHELMIRTYGYETARQQRTFNPYEDVHCFHSAGLHDWMKFQKLGYSKVTDHATREIRLKRMTRETGISLVEEYSRKEPADLQLFLDWCEIGEDEFRACVDRVRSPQAWEKAADGWRLRDSVANHRHDAGVDEVRLESKDDWQYLLTGSQEPNTPDEDYLLMGRGYLDRFNIGAVEPMTEGAHLLPRTWERTPLIKDY